MKLELLLNRSVHTAVIVSFFLTLAVACVWAEKLSIVYTGNTYATLYPCGTCPASVGGGLSRRATALKEVAAETKIIIVDSGNFMAGGQFDTKSVNPIQDKKRSSVCYQAMRTMGYDAVALGEDDFIFGSAYLSDLAAKGSPALVSANIALEGVVPYYIKEISGYKIAFIGLSPKSIYKKFGIEVKDYEETLAAVLKQLEGKCNAVVLLSALGDQESKRLAEKFQQLAVVIVSGPLFESMPIEKIGSTVIARAYHEGKAIGIISFDSEDKDFTTATFAEKRLSLERSEDQEIAKSLPACFRDEDCLSREGLISKCQDAGEITAVCAYYSAETINARIVTDRQCAGCSTLLTEQLLKDNFLGMRFRKIDYADQEGKELIERYKATTLPLFVIDPAIAQEKKFSQFSNVFQKYDDAYVLTTDLAGMFMFLERKEDPRRMDVFVDLYDVGTHNILAKLFDFAETNKINLQTHFLIVNAKNREYADEELGVALAVKELFPQKINEYLLLRAKQIAKTSWINTLDEIGINYKKVQQLLRSTKMETLRQKNSELSKALGVREGNVILIKNNRIFKVFDVNADELKQMFFQDVESKS